jgi:hypothetical protein
VLGNDRYVEAVVREAYASLVFNFDIWVNTATPIQKALCSTLEKRVENTPQVPQIF